MPKKEVTYENINLNSHVPTGYWDFTGTFFFKNIKIQFPANTNLYHFDFFD